ncbi:MAG: hypothetical protein IK059_03635, partial [Firmicutes bacterium]|nr:hypothetical protein [Bacillota bacterium]
GVDVGHITFFDGNKIVMTLVNDGSNQESVMFNFFHELAHSVLGHVYNTAGISDVDEKDALKWAQDMLVLGKGN